VNTGNTRYIAIIGHPIIHSLSPRMHQAAFNQLHLDYCYLPFDISPEKLKNGVEALKQLGFRGFNVTIPFKEKIIPLLDQISKEAAIIGAVNTVLIENGKLKGFNTDGAGFVESLKKKWTFSLKNKSALILGAGGAAKAVAAQLCLNQVGSIGIVNRTRKKADQLKARLKKHFPKVEVKVFARFGDDLDCFLKKAHLLVNSTSVGLHSGDDSPLPSQFFHKQLKVCDLIYNPSMTSFLKTAQKKGCSFINGRGMLLYQGALAFKIWTGKTAPVEVMSNALSLA